MANGIDSDSHLASCCWVVSKSGITSYTQMERERRRGRMECQVQVVRVGGIEVISGLIWRYCGHS